MKFLNVFWVLSIVLVVCISGLIEATDQEKVTCTSRGSKCFLKKITCPKQCPTTDPKDPKDKVCYIDCNSPVCQAECKNRIPNCHGKGAACLDPRFIGGDGIVFYFHGKKNEHFALVSDPNLQINARFIGLRPAGRFRDYTWIQALGFVFGSHTFTLEATKSPNWNSEIDHLSFTYNGEALIIPVGYPSKWTSPDSEVRAERILAKNSVIVRIGNLAEVSVNVVPITKEDDRVHNYQIPKDDCFAHLEVQFRFYGLSEGVEGVLGRTYQPEFVNPAKPGVAMAVVGGEDKYKTSSLVDVDCKSCKFSGYGGGELSVMESGMVDCSGGDGSGNGIVCRR